MTKFLTEERISSIKTKLFAEFPMLKDSDTTTIKETTRNGEEALEIECSEMYSYVDLGEKYSELRKLADLVGCKEINTDRWSSEGCETCSYGSSYDTTFTCWDFNE